MFILYLVLTHSKEFQFIFPLINIVIIIIRVRIFVFYIRIIGKYYQHLYLCYP